MPKVATEGTYHTARARTLKQDGYTRLIQLLQPLMATQKFKIRQLHRAIAPIMLLPIVITLITGSVYQVLDSQGKGEAVDWLMKLHKGHFGPLNLEIVYPYLNALGLLVLAITGISMWSQTRRSGRSSDQV